MAISAVSVTLASGTMLGAVLVAQSVTTRMLERRVYMPSLIAQQRKGSLSQLTMTLSSALGIPMVILDAVISPSTIPGVLLASLLSTIPVGRPVVLVTPLQVLKCPWVTLQVISALKFFQQLIQRIGKLVVLPKSVGH